jgi:hypothetical protein
VAKLRQNRARPPYRRGCKFRSPAMQREILGRVIGLDDYLLAQIVPQKKQFHSRRLK